MTSALRTAIVTGGARGIGAAVARRLAAGRMAVAVLDLDESAADPVVAALGPDHHDVEHVRSRQPGPG